MPQVTSFFHDTCGKYEQSSITLFYKQNFFYDEVLTSRLLNYT